MSVTQKPLIFLYPLTDTLKKLKEVIEETAERDGVEIYEVEDLEEYNQLFPTIGTSLTIAASPKKTAQGLQKNKKALQQLHSKVILLSPKQMPQKLVQKLEKWGLTEYLVEPIPPKKLHYKVNFLLKSIKIENEEAEEEKKFHKDEEELDDNQEQRLEKGIVDNPKEEEEESFYGRKKKRKHEENSYDENMRGEVKKKKQKEEELAFDDQSPPPEDEEEDIPSDLYEQIKHSHDADMGDITEERDDQNETHDKGKSQYNSNLNHDEKDEKSSGEVPLEHGKKASKTQYEEEDRGGHYRADLNKQEEKGDKEKGENHYEEDPYDGYYKGQTERPKNPSNGEKENDPLHEEADEQDQHGTELDFDAPEKPGPRSSEGTDEDHDQDDEDENENYDDIEFDEENPSKKQTSSSEQQKPKRKQNKTDSEKEDPNLRSSSEKQNPNGKYYKSDLDADDQAEEEDDDSDSETTLDFEPNQEKKSEKEESQDQQENENDKKEYSKDPDSSTYKKPQTKAEKENKKAPGKKSDPREESKEKDPSRDGQVDKRNDNWASKRDSTEHTDEEDDPKEKSAELDFEKSGKKKNAQKREEESARENEREEDKGFEDSWDFDRDSHPDHSEKQRKEHEQQALDSNEKQKEDGPGYSLEKEELDGERGITYEGDEDLGEQTINYKKIWDEFEAITTDREASKQEAGVDIDDTSKKSGQLDVKDRYKLHIVEGGKTTNEENNESNDEDARSIFEPAPKGIHHAIEVAQTYNGFKPDQSAQRKDYAEEHEQEILQKLAKILQDNYQSDSAYFCYDKNSRVFLEKHVSVLAPEGEDTRTYWKKLKKENFLLWKEVVLPTWEDPTFQNKRNQLIFPFFEGAHPLGFAILFSRDKLTEERAKEVEMLAETSRGVFLHWQKRDAEKSQYTEKSKGVLNKTRGLFQKVKTFFTGEAA